MDWHLIIYLSLSNYILAWFVVESHIMDSPRHHAKMATPQLRFGGVHILECRSCVSFWVAAGMAIATLDLSVLLPVWAVARYLKTQEREQF